VLIASSASLVLSNNVYRGTCCAVCLNNLATVGSRVGLVGTSESQRPDREIRADLVIFEQL
jgi:hypothetical protein